jgi:hypothetical protein
MKVLRREFIALVSGAAVWPLVGHTQQAGGVPRVGVLISGSPPDPMTGLLRRHLRDLATQKDRTSASRCAMQWIKVNALRSSPESWSRSMSIYDCCPLHARCNRRQRSHPNDTNRYVDGRHLEPLATGTRSHPRRVALCRLCGMYGAGGHLQLKLCRMGVNHCETLLPEHDTKRET